MRAWIGETSDVAKGIKTKLAERLDPLLHDFERSRWVWNRFDGEVLHVVELLGSKHGTGNLAVLWGLAPCGWRGLRPGPREVPVTTPQCAIYGSLGDFHRTSGWWDHKDVEDGVPEDLHHSIHDHLLPFFAEMSSMQSILALVSRGYSAYPKPKTALDENGWPLMWSWPRLPDHQKIVQGVVMLLGGHCDEGQARLDEVANKEFADRILTDESLS